MIGVWGWPRLHSEFCASPDYIARPCLKQTKTQLVLAILFKDSHYLSFHLYFPIVVWKKYPDYCMKMQFFCSPHLRHSDSVDLERDPRIDILTCIPQWSGWKWSKDHTLRNPADEVHFPNKIWWTLYFPDIMIDAINTTMKRYCESKNYRSHCIPNSTCYDMHTQYTCNKYLLNKQMNRWMNEVIIEWWSEPRKYNTLRIILL
jgi:hypothetical protein